MTVTRAALLLAVAAAIAAFFVFDLGRFLSLEFFAAQREAIAAFEAANPLLAAAAFFLLYVAVAALSLPGAALLTLAAGAVFGLAQGFVLVSFASSLGAACAFLIARYLLRDLVRRQAASERDTS